MLRPKLANRIFATIAELEAELTAQLQPCWAEPASVRRLTGYPWWTAAAATLPRSP